MTHDTVLIQGAINRVRQAMSLLEEINDEMIFDYLGSQYETLDDIQIELTNTLNSVANGEFDD